MSLIQPHRLPFQNKSLPSYLWSPLIPSWLLSGEKDPGMLQASSESSIDDLSEASNSELNSMGSGSAVGLNMSVVMENEKKKDVEIDNSGLAKSLKRAFKMPCKTARYCSKTTLTAATPVFWENKNIGGSKFLSWENKLSDGTHP